MGKANYTEGESTWTVPRFDNLGDGEKYLPFIYGQKYDDFRLFPQTGTLQSKIVKDNPWALVSELLPIFHELLDRILSGNPAS